MSYKEEQIRGKVIEDITRYLQAEGDKIRLSVESIDEQVIQMDVVLDVLRCLARYKENIQVLNEYYFNKSRFEGDDIYGKR